MRKYYLPLVVFSLAALIKFTVIPVIILFILVIVCKQRQIVSLPRLALRDKLRSWYVLFQSFLFACALSAGVALAFYAPFWVGHSAGEILFSFTSAPAARSASNSLLSVILIGKDFLHIPPTILSGQFLNELSQRSLWDRITLVAVVGSSVLSARQLWRKPTILTFAQTSLIVLSVLLMVTPWFYPWYILWLVGLAIVCLPPVTNRWGRALVGFALVFSLSAFLTYFFSGEIALMSAWEQFFRARIPILLVGSALLFINTLVPPVLTLFGIAFAPRSNLKG